MVNDINTPHWMLYQHHCPVEIEMTTVTVHMLRHDRSILNLAESSNYPIRTMTVLMNVYRPVLGKIVSWNGPLQTEKKYIYI